MAGSKAFSLSSDDLKSLGKSFLLGFIGFALTFAATYVVPALESSDAAWAAAVAAGLPVVINVLRKFVPDTSKGK